MEIGFKEITEPLETIYVAGDDLAFVSFIKANHEVCEMCVVNGKFRWVITNEDGTRNIVRPIKAKDEK